MIQYDIFISRMSKNRCIKNNFRLSKNEYLVSRKSFPNLYDKEFNKQEGEYLKIISSFIHKYNRDILNLPKIELEKIQRFYNTIIISDDKYISERTIHLYIFLFWEKLSWDKNIINTIKKENFFYEGQKINYNNNPKFQDNLLPHISNNCDLIYYNKEHFTVELIEIKNVDLDDRAISQIQRYYRNTNLICETYRHNLNILNIQPTLIIKHEKSTYKKGLLEYWLTFPTYFRELLQIYSFSYCKKNETLKLTNLKPTIKSMIRNR